MKIILILFSIFLTIKGYSQKVDTLLVNFQNHKFYFVEAKGDSNLIIFLHGGVNNPEFNKLVETPSLDFLLEENMFFIQSCIINGYNILIPVKDDSLNWLTNHNYCIEIFDSLLVQKKISKSTLLISGFSDGGTASYKIFYDNSSKFDGLIMFNGYPQHSNFNQKIIYNEVTNKKIIFASTKEDKVIPYEFLLAEYANQKIFNPCTYLYLTEGKHSFNMYLKSDFNTLFDIINEQNVNTKTEPIHGFTKNDILTEFYPFRKRILRKYNFGKELYKSNRLQKRQLKNKNVG